MNTVMIVIGVLGAFVSLLILIVSCLPSPTIQRLAKQFANRNKPKQS